MINTICKLLGLNKIWVKVDGYKTKIAGVLSILVGLIGMIEKLQTVLAQHDFQALITFAQQLPTDQSVLLLLGGLGVIGIGHKLEKQTNAKNNNS